VVIEVDRAASQRREHARRRGERFGVGGVRGLVDQAQPLLEPSVRPLTKCRCSIA
jgi:hypothetical protein